ncbi:hypothetical protein [Pseudomonas sp. SORGH_AS_0211]|uniref:hypothetical protein n=1 Tax=Pseudomonas sp. SORGH_AS_0211 TaxID=3041796 RepID=UPI00286D6996|nr:hypothetical protein [Pseudomonas sp. SORGH_AS_0211]
MTLMKSIAKDGLGTVSILVSTAGNKYKVWDGNRRVACLKLLNKPSLCPSLELRRRIEKLGEIYKDNIPKTVECHCCDIEEVLVREVLSRHSGARGGAGQVVWSSYLRTLFLLEHKQSSQYKRAGQYLYWSEGQGIEVEDEFPVSTLARFLKQNALLGLGFVVQDDKLKLVIEQEKAKHMASKVIADLASKALKVDDLRSINQGNDYIASVRFSVGLTEPAEVPAGFDAEDYSVNDDGGDDNYLESEKRSDDWGEDSNSDEPVNPTGTQQNPLGGTVDSAKPSGGGSRIGPRSGLRLKVFSFKGSGLVLPPEEKKVKDIVFELAKLKHSGKDGTPISVAFLLRALVELSTNNYLERYPEAMRKEDSSLRARVKACAEHMCITNAISKERLGAIISNCTNEGGLINITTLQKYLHNTERFPSGETLNALWDEISEYVIACW